MHGATPESRSISVFGRIKSNARQKYQRLNTNKEIKEFSNEIKRM